MKQMNHIEWPCNNYENDIVAIDNERLKHEIYQLLHGELFAPDEFAFDRNKLDAILSYDKKMIWFWYEWKTVTGIHVNEVPLIKTELGKIAQEYLNNYHTQNDNGSMQGR